jgi:hypothetical protein
MLSLCHYVHMKTRRDDRLSNLDPSSRTKLDAWLRSHTYREVVQLAAAPRPDGLGLQTNIRALSVYFRKYLVPSPVDRLFKLALTNPDAAESAAVAMLGAQAFHAASSPNINIHTFNAITRFLFRKRTAGQRKLATHTPNEVLNEHAA